MARKRRADEIDLNECRVYHVVSRCVRSLRLLSTDGDGRKELCLQVLQSLTEVTAVQVAAFSLMDNHLHLLLRVDVEQAEVWTEQEVVERWLALHPVRNGYFEPVETPDGRVVELANEPELVEATRQKLVSISQFMKELKQRIAQVANRDDGTSGAFWAGRFKIKAVRDEAQLLTTLAYIDLNPFAANICEKPEDGKYTSLEGRLGLDRPRPVQPRRRDHRSERRNRPRVRERATQGIPGTRAATPKPLLVGLQVRRPTGHWLVPLDESKESNGQITARLHAESAAPQRARRPDILLSGLSLQTYMKLLDITSRLLRAGKKRLFRQSVPILERLALTPSGLAEAVVGLFDGRSQHPVRVVP